jgi:predicted DCC family thiol-disulfide oxidoreductase YuxK
MNLPRLFYDADCPLCSREIDLLRRRLRQPLTLVNVHGLEPEAGVPDAGTLLRILHYQSAEGHWHTGLDATVSAWRHTRYGLLFGWLRWPLIKPLADRLYRRWADRRYCRNYACRAGH